MRISYWRFRRVLFRSTGLGGRIPGEGAGLAHRVGLLADPAVGAVHVADQGVAVAVDDRGQAAGGVVGVADRKSVGLGKSVSVRVDLGCRRIVNTKITLGGLDQRNGSYPEE